jgi:hypothetical protein
MSLNPIILQRIFRIRQEGLHQIVTRNDAGHVYGICATMDEAIETAICQARETSRAGYRVILELKQPNGKWKTEYIADPPIGDAEVRSLDLPLSATDARAAQRGVKS